MKRWVAAVVAWSMCFLASNAEADKPIRLRVLSYNIHHAAGVDGRLDLDRIAAVISSVQPDLVALQEVDRNVSRSGSVDQPAELARLTTMNVAFGGNIELQGGDYGNAVLSRFPIVREKNHLLPNFQNGEQRGALDTTVKLSNSEVTLRLIATHFDHRRDDRERIASAQAINRWVKDSADEAALLLGDLNDIRASEAIRNLLTDWQAVNDQPLPTIPVSEPRKQIDYIFMRPANRWRVIETRVLDEAVASDHRAIFAVLELVEP